MVVLKAHKHQLEFLNGDFGYISFDPAIRLRLHLRVSRDTTPNIYFIHGNNRNAPDGLQPKMGHSVTPDSCRCLSSGHLLFSSLSWREAHHLQPWTSSLKIKAAPEAKRFRAERAAPIPGLILQIPFISRILVDCICVICRAELKGLIVRNAKKPPLFIAILQHYCNIVQFCGPDLLSVMSSHRQVWLLHSAMTSLCHHPLQFLTG